MAKNYGRFLAAGLAGFAALSSAKPAYAAPAADTHACVLKAAREAGVNILDDGRFVIEGSTKGLDISVVVKPREALVTVNNPASGIMPAGSGTPGGYGLDHDSSSFAPQEDSASFSTSAPEDLTGTGRTQSVAREIASRAARCFTPS